METTRRKHQGSEGFGLNGPNRVLAEQTRDHLGLVEEEEPTLGLRVGILAGLT